VETEPWVAEKKTSEVNTAVSMFTLSAGFEHHQYLMLFSLIVLSWRSDLNQQRIYIPRDIQHQGGNDELHGDDPRLATTDRRNEDRVHDG
jgi:hypothetical protein